jgi:hypothetical protein
VRKNGHFKSTSSKRQPVPSKAPRPQGNEVSFLLKKLRWIACVPVPLLPLADSRPDLPAPPYSPSSTISINRSHHEERQGYSRREADGEVLSSRQCDCEFDLFSASHHTLSPSQLSLPFSSLTLCYLSFLFFLLGYISLSQLLLALSSALCFPVICSLTLPFSLCYLMYALCCS